MTPVNSVTTVQAAMSDIPTACAPTTANTPNSQQIMITAKEFQERKEILNPSLQILVIFTRYRSHKPY